MYRNCCWVYLKNDVKIKGIVMGGWIVGISANNIMFLFGW